MPGLSSSDIVSQVPSLADVLLCAANPEETPLLTRTKKGKALTEMTHHYFVKLKPDRKTGGATDGQDVNKFEGDGQRFETIVRAQEFRRTPKVGQQSQNIVTDSTISDQFAYLKLVLGKEILKDQETLLMADTVGAADEGIEDRGSRLAGIGDRLRDSTFTQTDNPIPTPVRIPTNQILTGSLATTITENSLVDAMEARRNACGNSPSLVMFAGTKVQRKFDEFENYFPASTAGTQTTTIQMISGDAMEKKVTRGVRFYEGSFGTLEIVIEDFMPNVYRGYLMDMEETEILPYGKMVTFTPLPDLGGGPRGLLASTMAYKVGDPRAHIAWRTAA